MTEVLTAPLVIDEAVFYDGIGNPLDWQANLDFEGQQLAEYLKNYREYQKAQAEQDENEMFVYLPQSILAKMAANGRPSMSDFYLRWGSRYIHHDKEVFDSALATYEANGLIEQDVAETNVHQDKFYKLTDLARELLPDLDSVAAIGEEQAAARDKENKFWSFVYKVVMRSNDKRPYQTQVVLLKADQAQEVIRIEIAS